MPSTRALIAAYLEQTREVVARIDPQAIEAFTDVLFAAWQSGNTIYLCGNGGSAGTAQHMACDLFKCTIVPGKPRLRVLCLNDNMPLLSALTNDDGWSEVYVQQLITWWRPGDVVLGISVHGGVGQDKAGAWSQNVLRACAYAKEHGGKALALVGFDGGAMQELCDATILVPVESTPHTEGLHVVMHHLVTTALRDKIERS
jgi:D-sedoheptulose 7-phosphate isomerase